MRKKKGWRETLPIYLGAFFRAHLMLIALVVLLFDGSCLFQFTQFRGFWRKVSGNLFR